MASYTTTQDGDWTNPATWGGGGYPSADGDTANINHHIVYDLGQSDVYFGNVAVGSSGTLTFPNNASSRIKFNNTAIFSAPGAPDKIICGSEASPLDKAYTLEIVYAASGNGRYCLPDSFALFGDPDYYGSERYAYLKSNWATGSTTMFTIGGDYTSKWQAGQHVWIYANSGSYTTWDSVDTSNIFQISSIAANGADTDITVTSVNGSSGTFYTGGIVVNLSRNIQIYDEGSSWDLRNIDSYTTSVRSSLSSGVTSYHHYQLYDVLMRGLSYGVYNGNNQVLSRCAFVNISLCINSGSSYVDADVVSCGSAFYQGDTFKGASGIIGVCGYAFNGSNSSVFRGDIYCCDRMCNSKYPVIYGGMIGNNYCCDLGIVICLGGTVKANNQILRYAAMPNAQVILEDCEIDGTYKELEMYQNAGDVLCLHNGDSAWQTPDSGNNWILQLNPNGYADNSEKLEVSKLSIAPCRQMSAFVPAGAKTLSFKVYPYGWSPGLDQGQMYIRAYYLSDASSFVRAEVVTAAKTYTNGAWDSCTVSFNQARAGVVYFNLYLGAYQSGCYVLIDPVWDVS